MPQGSILGPLLFLLYINDICKSSTYLTFILYADDTNIFFSSANVSDTCEIINRELKNVMQWFITNRLSVNLKKTCFMGFGAKAHSSFGSNKISLNGVDIAKVNHAKFLGVLVDDKLTWKSHITHISNKVAKNIGILNKLRHLCSIEYATHAL